jgi:microcystin-dependent protein
MKSLRGLAAGAALSLALLAGAARAQTAAQLIYFQGLLADSLGQPLPDGAVDIRFVFYGQESGGLPCLSVLQEDVATEEGRFALLIGSGTLTPGTEASLADLFQKHGEVWLGIAAGGNGEMTPRTHIGSAPYAIRADDGVPRGGIITWSGALAAIPAGWRLCDGTGGTPDLRDRFILGTSAGQQPGGTGGSTQRQLAASQMPAHPHSLGTSEDGNDVHSVSFTAVGLSFANHWIGGLVPTPLCYDDVRTQETASTESSGNHTHTGTTAGAGGGAAFATLPPYYKVAYIMKI